MTSLHRGVFVTGTDTGVGKTVVSACLVCHWAMEYWKPVQTGLASDPADTDTVLRLAGVGPARAHKSRHELQAPLSPEAAATLENHRIKVADFSLPESRAPVLVEGAGGVMVPLGDGALMVDLMRALGLPVVLVARSTLGTINHTLLSLEALRRRGVSVLGVVLCGEVNTPNRNAIERYGDVSILAELPPLSPLTPASIEATRSLFPASPFTRTLAA